MSVQYLRPADSGWLCCQILETTRDAVIVADRDGIIRFWNPGAAIMFGYEAAEALGQSLDLIIPENLRARHDEGYRRVMAAGITKYEQEVLAVPGRRKDGSHISLEFGIALIRDQAGEILGTAAILRDVTARYEREKELKKRLAALEESSGE